MLLPSSVPTMIGLSVKVVRRQGMSWLAHRSQTDGVFV